MRKINVLFILPKTQQGGAETQMLYLLRGLDRHKFNPCLGLLYRNEQLKKEFEAIKGVRIIDFKKKSKFDFLVYLQIARFIRKNNMDIICSFMGNHHSYLPALISGKATAVGGVRNTALAELNVLERFKELTLNKMMTKLSKYVLVSNSHSAKQAYVQKGFDPDRIEVVPNGIDFEAFSNGNKKSIIKEFHLANKFVITTVGRLVKSKNHYELINNFRDITDHNKNAVLLIIGDGPEREKLESLAKSLNLSKNIIFTGNRHDVADFLAATELFVFPSKHPEGWPNVIGEAMAAGVPVVTYPAGDIKHIIKNRLDGVITKKDMNVFITEVISLINDRKRRERLGKNAQNAIRDRFSVKEMVKRYENIFIGHGEGEK